MANKVLLITRGTAFLTNALVTSLKNAGVSVEQTGFESDQVAKYEEDTNIFLFFAGNEDYLPSALLRHLKDICGVGSKHLCVLGYGKELNEIEAIIPKESIRREFLRPIDVKTITEELCKLLKEKPAGARKSILLVDDDVAYLRILEGWLSEKYDVTAVKSGMQAIAYIGTHKPDLILLDYDMPGTSGPQVLEMIRVKPDSADTPVLFLTGKDDRESVMSVMALKPDGYLLKVSGKESITAAVDAFFEKRR